MKKYLAISASSTESKKLFSAAGKVITKKRTRLEPEVVDEILFIQKNMLSFLASVKKIQFIVKEKNSTVVVIGSVIVICHVKLCQKFLKLTVFALVRK